MKIMLNSLAAILLISATITAAGSTPTSMNIQGQLTDALGEPLPDSEYVVTFSIYDQPQLGKLRWTETISVVVSRGLFSVLLGNANPNTPLDHTVFDTSSLYLSMKVGQDEEMTPRTILVSVPYSLRTATIDGADGGAITGNLDITGNLSVLGVNTAIQLNPDFIGDESVKFPPDAISSDEITDLSLSNADISENAAIGIDKIDGTAMNLGDSQLVVATKVFKDLRITPRNQYLSIPGPAFVTNNYTTVNPGGVLLGALPSPPGVPGFFAAPIFLPHGAVMTQFEASFLDESDTVAVTFHIIRRDKSEPSNITTLASLVPTGSASGWRTISTPLTHTIDNRNHFYFVTGAAFGHSGPPWDLGVAGVIITYWVSRP